MLLSIGDQVKPGSYRLHSIFKRAVNFEHRGRLISVVDETIGPGPLNIVLRTRARARESHVRECSADFQSAVSRICNPQSLVTSRRASRLETCDTADWKSALRVASRTVLFAGHRYHFTSRHRYHSTIELKAADPDRFHDNLSVLSEVLKQDAPPKSLAFLLDAKRRKNFGAGFEQAYAKQIERGVRQVFHGDLLAGIRHLKGCGLGLTPGGDDFIAGLLVGLHLLQKLRGQTLQPKIDAVFGAAQGNNIFSNTFLDLARRGLVVGRMKDLILALGAGSGDGVWQTAGALFAIGGSSGADWAAGLFVTLHALGSSPDNPPLG